MIENKVKIGDLLISKSNPTFVIAEIGINHNGSIDTAIKLIDKCVEAGVQAVKFQKRTIDKVYTKQELEKTRENPFGPTNGDLKRALEFGKKEYDIIDNYCKKKKILWTASCWDEDSLDFILKYKPPFLKIASASLTDSNLLKKHLKTKLPILLSTGMSTMDQIENAVKIIGEKNNILLHCTSSYPCDPKELNLSLIKILEKNFPNMIIGYSGHETGLSTSIAANVLGAKVIERHVTLDRSMWGSDQSASLEPIGLYKLVRDIRIIESSMGAGFKTIYESEKPIIKKLRRVTDY
tara:strand:+ start:2281 stop:3162 length:882 start_codon:yes stop_codon:yes gene_type:complete